MKSKIGMSHRLIHLEKKDPQGRYLHGFGTPYRKKKGIQLPTDPPER